MKPIVEVKGLWKEYQRGAQKEKYLSLRDNLFKSFKPSAKKESFWALEDINFEVYPGDSLAIIGKNGAGKSTLLKILSRITPPTKGEITLRGRLASLLEVGTGFHPELTGRENIYLNGSILGLGRSEINRQFDAIVDFSGVEAFLDTPLKHYSSGMQLRLAFAVAAHLEPEILVIDEVLAVGDSAFQQKCIDKMTEVSRSGRTILFVSHNMHAIKSLCTQSLLIKDGILIDSGQTSDVINLYLQSQTLHTRGNYLELTEHKRKVSVGTIRFKSLILNNWNPTPGDTLDLKLELEEDYGQVHCNLLFGLAILNDHGQTLIHLSNFFIGKAVDKHHKKNRYSFSIPGLPLSSGRYSLTLFLKSNEEIQDWIEGISCIEVKDGNRYDFNNTKMINGLIQPEFLFDAIDG
jgi:lipopolysaccharide transport system ATP-binding protein